MKQLFFYSFMLLAIASCSSDFDNPFSYNSDPSTGSGTMTSGSFSGGTATGQTTVGVTDITTFDINLNVNDDVTEVETVPTDESDAHYEDFIENWPDEKKAITITYNGNSATYNGSVDGVTVTIDGANVTVVSTKKKIEYTLKGSSTNGSFKIYSDNKFSLVLKGLTLTNPNGAAINIQKGSDGGKRCYLQLASGTTNTLTDGTSYTQTPTDEDEKGCIFAEGKLLVCSSTSSTGSETTSGQVPGKLIINAQGKSGIVSDDYVYLHAGTNVQITSTKTDGIKTNDGIFIGGGVLNISCSGTAGKGLNTEGEILVAGGRSTIITSGGAEYDSTERDISSSMCVKSDSVVNVTGGSLLMKSTGAAGKGLKADEALNVSGGLVEAITTGKMYSYSGNLTSSPKGIRVGDKTTKTGAINISGGEVVVRCTGGEGSEGIESKNSITISGPSTGSGQVVVESYCYDDAINATSNITISGGNVFGYATNNDGIDSNGTITISGGNILASGTTSPEEGIDCDQNTFTITGGTIVGLGGTTSTPSSSTSKQVSLVTSLSMSQNALVSVCNSNGECIFAFKAPRSYNGATMLISSPSMTQGSTIQLCSGGTLTGGTDFHGLLIGGTLASGSTVASTTLSSIVNGSASSGMGGGGNMGGGGGMGPGGR